MRTGIALGSNLGERLENLREARRRIFALPNIGEPLLSSRIYETEPVGCEPGVAPFLNAVIEVDFSGNDPRALLRELRKIESDFGRPSRHPRNAPRTLDLDILYFGNTQFSADASDEENGAELALELPHPRLHERRFVLAPLAEIRPDLLLPGQKKIVAELLAALPAEPRALVTEHSF